MLLAVRFIVNSSVFQDEISPVNARAGYQSQAANSLRLQKPGVGYLFSNLTKIAFLKGWECGFKLSIPVKL